MNPWNIVLPFLATLSGTLLLLNHFRWLCNQRFSLVACILDVIFCWLCYVPVQILLNHTLIAELHELQKQARIAANLEEEVVDLERRDRSCRLLAIVFFFGTFVMSEGLRVRSM